MTIENCLEAQASTVRVKRLICRPLNIYRYLDVFFSANAHKTDVLGKS